MLVRPPGAVDEVLFLDRCSRCNDCITACPEHLLIRAEAGFPERDWQRGECTFCGECIAACQPRALLPLAQQPWPWRAAIGEDCLAAHGVTCQSCREVCPENAIRFSPGAPRPVLDPARCSGCGVCTAVCPVAAITMQQLRNDPVAMHD
ncbi:MAG: ferredoxin-type protein NapF [Gammaproteobacteria bacterium HGW-Gammaproteobacteria-8]|nr:MAG: ferredoxin-type protein NapF [Gammaproteobacteria bacterium HGW-Gammaproteobacteria-8]PKM16234.1 MAG: ferredoxin-type protein NapF [Gammaproteobacteria bacterium HGW-Gammaproteobacteria-2]